MNTCISLLSINCHLSSPLYCLMSCKDTKLLYVIFSCLLQWLVTQYCAYMFQQNMYINYCLPTCIPSQWSGHNPFQSIQFVWEGLVQDALHPTIQISWCIHARQKLLTYKILTLLVNCTCEVSQLKPLRYLFVALTNPNSYVSRHTYATMAASMLISIHWMEKFTVLFVAHHACKNVS